MFGISMPEMILVVAIALILIGPKKLPDLAKSLGRAIGEFKKNVRDIDANNDIKQPFSNMNRSDVYAELKKSYEDSENKGLMEVKITPKSDVDHQKTEVSDNDDKP